MGNIRRDRKRESTLFKTLIILALGVALIVTVIVFMLSKDKKGTRTLIEHTDIDYIEK